MRENGDEVFYDLEFDQALIEASFAMQYGIRLAVEDIRLGEFLRLLGGLMADTPLGRAVAVRAEVDAARIKNFGVNERELRRKWRNFKQEQAMQSKHSVLSKQSNRDWDKDIEGLKHSLQRAFGGDA